MKSQQKRMANEFVATLHEAHSEVYKNIKGKHIAELYDLRANHPDEIANFY